MLAATFIYRRQRRWGATPLVASWQLMMSSVLQAVGLTVLGIGGALLLGNSTNPLALIFSLAGLVAVMLFVQTVAARPELIEGVGTKALGKVNALRGKPIDTGVTKWRELLGQLETVRLGRRDLSLALGWSLFNWVADVCCLAFACHATGSHPALAGVAMAYAAGRAVSSIPLMPGGLLVVEAVLVPGLVAAGLPLAAAISAMLIYRLVSWIFLAAIGWVMFFFLFRAEKDVDPDR